MANEISHRHDLSGASLYAVVFDRHNKVYDPASGLVNLVVANWADYAIALTETPSGSYIYAANFPDLANGDYIVRVFDIGTGQEISDTLIGEYAISWYNHQINDLSQLAATLATITVNIGGIPNLVVDTPLVGAPLTLIRAIKVIMATMVGNSTFDTNSIVHFNNMQNQEVASVKLIGNGERTNSTIV
jgi:hypothetical protein